MPSPHELFRCSHKRPVTYTHFYEVSAMPQACLLAVVFLLSLSSASHSVLLPVTGDTTAVWTAIDLSPTNNKMENVSIATGDSTSGSERSFDEYDTESRQPPSEPQTQTDAPRKKETLQQSSYKAEKSAAESTPAASAPAAETAAASVADTTSAATAQDSVAPIIPGTIIITSIPDSARITINDVSVGTTPYNVHGFYPGLYDITVSADGYTPITKAIELAAGATEFITTQLIAEAGYLFVNSDPLNATVAINDTIVGMTPYSSKPLSPGVYNLTVELPGYFPYKEQLGISPNLTDSLHIPLQTAEKPGIFTSTRFKDTQTLRRISFGAATVIGTAAGFILNNMTKSNLEREQSALLEYREAKLSESEYTARYNNYKTITETTNRYALVRSLCYGVGIIGGAGFSISIIY